MKTRFWRGIAYGVICSFLALCLAMVGFATIYGGSVNRVLTGSMEPSIPVNSLTFSERVDETNANKLRVKDVVTVLRPDDGVPITHRIVEIDQQLNGNILITTKGDANSSPDQPVKRNRVVAKVIGVLPYNPMWVGGYLFALAASFIYLFITDSKTRKDKTLNEGKSRE